MGLNIDLRSENEIEQRPDPAIEGIENLELSIGSSAQRDGFEDFDLKDYYLKVLSENPEVFVEVARRVAGNPRATLIHCTAGKDRTGIAIGLLLSLVGVTDEGVLQNYEISEDYVGDLVTAEVRRMLPENSDDGLTAAVLGSPREAMQAVLDQVRVQSCTTRGWFIDHGLEEEVIDTLVQRLTEVAEA